MRFGQVVRCVDPKLAKTHMAMGRGGLIEIPRYPWIVGAPSQRFAGFNLFDVGWYKVIRRTHESEKNLCGAEYLCFACATESSVTVELLLSR